MQWVRIHWALRNCIFILVTRRLAEGTERKINTTSIPFRKQANEFA
jgi:hypothetical protein